MERKIKFDELLGILPCDVMVGVIEYGNGRSVSVSMFVDDWYDITHPYVGRYVSMISDVKKDEIAVILSKEGTSDEDSGTAR